MKQLKHRLRNTLRENIYGDLIVSEIDNKLFISVYNDVHCISWGCVITPEIWEEEYFHDFDIMVYSIIKRYMSAVFASLVHGFDLVDIYEK